jgi:cysteine-rich repeat protein
LKHEQQRPDRDSYLTVDCSRVCGEYIYKPAPNADIIDHCTNADCGQNTCTGHGCNFKQVTATDQQWDWAGPYDVLSVMQYGSTLFARPETGWLPPVTAKDPRIPLRPGNGQLPTLTDLNRVCNLYYKECRGICGDGILSLNNGEQCDDGNNRNGDGCDSDCKIRSVCGNGVREAGEECDDGNTISGDGCSATCKKEYCGDGIVQPGLGEECDAPGSADCTSACKKPCLMEECNPDPRYNKCHITTSCIKIVDGTAASAGKHYCACEHGFRANGATPGDTSAQMRLPWLSQQGRVFVKPGLQCNIMCNEWTLGRDGCKEVVEKGICY